MALKILNFHYAEIGKREAVCLRLMHARPEGRHCALLRFDSAFDFLGHFVLVLELCQVGVWEGGGHAKRVVLGRGWRYQEESSCRREDLAGRLTVQVTDLLPMSLCLCDI